MPKTTAGELKAGTDVFGLEVGELLDDLLDAEPVRQEVEDVTDPDAHAPNAGTTAALLWVDGDPVGEVVYHPISRES